MEEIDDQLIWQWWTHTLRTQWVALQSFQLGVIRASWAEQAIQATVKTSPPTSSSSTRTINLHQTSKANAVVTSIKTKTMLTGLNCRGRAYSKTIRSRMAITMYQFRRESSATQKSQAQVYGRQWRLGRAIVTLLLPKLVQRQSQLTSHTRRHRKLYKL